MREILFRGKRIDNGEWVEGYLYASNISGCYILQTQTKHRKLKSGGVEIYDQLIPIQVDGSTVGQYTGLTDKNGKNIFEGDILFCAHEIGMGYREFRGKVVYKAPKFYVDCGNIVLTLDSAYTIIGNIYDNPELLEG